VDRPNAPPEIRLAPTPEVPAGGLVPCLLLRRGQVCRPGETGPVPARSPDGKLVDPFEVIDRIARDHSLLYLVDLDGIERTQPQLDYIQEFSRDIALWVDAGVRDADQSIDILVAGAQRAVVSSAMLEGPDELERAWGLSTELVFEIAFEDGSLRVRSEWSPTSALGLAQTVREVGIEHLVVSPRGAPPDWAMIRSIAKGGPTWVDGSFEPSDAQRLSEAGAAGGIFHIDAILDEPRDEPEAS